MKEMREAIKDAGLHLQVSGQTLAELHDIYDEVVLRKALEIRCECEFPTLPPKSLENGSLGKEVLSFDFKDGGRFIQDPNMSLSEIVKTMLSLFASVLRFTDTFCTEDKTAPYRQVSDVLPDLVSKFAEGSHVGGAEQLKKRALRHALDSKAIPLERGASGSVNYGDWSVRSKLQTPPQKSLR